MSWTDLLPAPNSALKAFSAFGGKADKGQEQHPYAQQLARNWGHAAFGDKIGTYVDQHLLGDVAPGTMAGAPDLSAQQLQMGANGQNPMQGMVQKYLMAQQMNSPMLKQGGM